MNLTPEPPSSKGFRARVESYRVGEGAINRVLFPTHVVRRSLADVAASDRSCFYLNLKLAGGCRIRQADHELALSPGRVGIFESEKEFALIHDGGPRLEVVSFLVPSQRLRERLPSSFRFSAACVSDDRLLGRLIVETARVLNADILQMSEEESVRLFDVLIELVAMSLSPRRYANITEADGLADAATLRLKRAIYERLREPGLAVGDVAGAVGISERYVHKLLQRLGLTFNM